MHIEHINISTPMSLLTQVRDFYIDILGLTEGFRPQSTIRGFWLYSGKQALIHLAESDGHFASLSYTTANCLARCITSSTSQ